MKFRFSDLNADTIKKGFEHIRSTAIPEALSKARSMVTGLDLADDRFFKESLEADEEALAKQLAEMKKRKSRLVDPLQFEMSIQAEDLSGYVPSFGWEMAPATDKQKAVLEKLGILPDQIDNAGKAQKLLDRLDKRRDEGLTTPKQIRFLEGRGFQHVGTWQFDDARKMIDRIAANGWRVPAGVNPAEYRAETGIKNGTQDRSFVFTTAY